VNSISPEPALLSRTPRTWRSIPPVIVVLK
jgi:hypothetical protein